jgi:hypothetical protein
MTALPSFTIAMQLAQMPDSQEKGVSAAASGGDRDRVTGR